MNIDKYNSFVDNFINDRFNYVNLPRPSQIITKPKNKSFEIILKSNENSKSNEIQKTNISKICKMNFNVNSIQTLPKEYLESIMILETPKKVISYVDQPDNTNSSKLGHKPKSKGNRGNKSNKRSSAEQSSEVDVNNNTVITKKPRKGDDNYEYEDKEYKYLLSKTVGTITVKKIPENLYKVITKICEDFWELDYDPPEVSFAFFALINSRNCHEYHLQDFAVESCSLAVIKDKINNKLYSTADEFVVDFRQMFKNILQYYPSTHLAYSKAIELSKLFELRWETDKDLIK